MWLLPLGFVVKAVSFSLVAASVLIELLVCTHTRDGISESPRDI